MKFIPVREFRLHPGSVWRKLKEERELVLTSRGKPIGLLAPLDEASFEQTLRAFRQARGAQAIAQLRAEAEKSGASRMTPAQIQKEINAVRRSRRPAA
jgi:antitoxin (DNA-binding transcriptional repressor) of toxin-antitoxin stability system